MDIYCRWYINKGCKQSTRQLSPPSFSQPINKMCGGGQTNEQKELLKRNAEIENGIKKDKITAEKEVKMLLLGIRSN
jgi:hypothetical protein